MNAQRIRPFLVRVWWPLRASPPSYRSIAKMWSRTIADEKSFRPTFPPQEISVEITGLLSRNVINIDHFCPQPICHNNYCLNGCYQTMSHRVNNWKGWHDFVFSMTTVRRPHRCADRQLVALGMSAMFTPKCDFRFPLPGTRWVC
jgi:hypothetical protein